jgi:hypothetical protein
MLRLEPLRRELRCGPTSRRGNPNRRSYSSPSTVTHRCFEDGRLPGADMKMHKCRRLPRVAGAAASYAAALVLGACDRIIVDPGVRLVVYGRVTNSLGAAVSGATVRLVVCAADFGFVEGSTDTTGYYREEWLRLGYPSTGCVKVLVNPPQGSPLTPDSVIRQGVPITSAGDSIRVDVTLR